MGLLSILGTAARGLLGGLAPTTAGVVPRIAGAATVATGGSILGGALSTIGRAIISPFGQGLVGGGIGATLAGGFGGDGAVAPAGGAFGFGAAGGQVLPGSPLGMIQAQGIPVTSLVGGRFMATAPNGDVQVFNRIGFPVRPSEIIPAGQRLPGGATVVSIRQSGGLIGVTKRRRRRSFAGEIQRTRRVLAGCRAIERACVPPKRRTSHR